VFLKYITLPGIYQPLKINEIKMKVKIFFMTLLFGFVLQAFSQYEILDEALITNEVPDEWRSNQNFPEFFLFSNNTELFLSIRDINNEWKTLQLYNHNPNVILEVNISGATVYSNKTDQEINFLYLVWSFELHHSWGNGGFGSNENHIQVIDLDKGKLVFEFTSYYKTSGSESRSDSDITNSGAEYQCEYSIDYEFSGDSIIIQSVNISDSYSNSWKDDGEELTKKEEDNSDCIPDINEGVYVYDGKAFVMIVDGR
jgi:hypothetical protein